MTAEDVVQFIQFADEEDIEIIKAACKGARKPPKVTKTHLIQDDIAELCKVLPRTTTTNRDHKYETTAVAYVRMLRSFADVILHSFAVHFSSRGYPVWGTCDVISESRAEDYKAVFHELTITVLDLMEQYGVKYN